MNNHLSSEKEQTLQVERLNLQQLEARIQKLRDQGHSYDHIFLTISNGWQYGSLKLPQVRTLAHLRTIISSVMHHRAVA